LAEKSCLRKPLHEAIRFYYTGRFEEAVELMEPRLKEKACHLNGIPGKASREFRKEIHLTPRYVAARFNLASCLAEQGRRKEARSQLARVLKLDSYQPLARKLYTRLGQPS
jgi:tetratricopeptide (TPR) repeat protein